MFRLKRGQVIYDQARPSIGIYLVIHGRIKACVSLDDGTQAALGIYGRDDFFGETGLLGLDSYPERAVALDDASVMAWTRADIEEQIERNPRLGVALMQTAVTRCLDLETRLEALANEKTPARVARAVVELAERLGTRRDDGTVQVPPLTHQLLAEYVGTSREIVTFQMNQLRQAGYVQYSRRHLDVYLDALKDYLRPSGVRKANGGEVMRSSG
jgi:CRP-like cAMP-binding protein